MLSFYHLRLNKLRNLIPRTEKTNSKKKNVYRNAATLYNSLLAICFNDYNNITDEIKEQMDTKYIKNPSNLFLKGYKYDQWYKKDGEKSKSQSEEAIGESVKLRRLKADDEDLSHLPPLEGV